MPLELTYLRYEIQKSHSFVAIPSIHPSIHCPPPENWAQGNNVKMHQNTLKIKFQDSNSSRSLTQWWMMDERRVGGQQSGDRARVYTSVVILNQIPGRTSLPCMSHSKITVPIRYRSYQADSSFHQAERVPLGRQFHFTDVKCNLQIFLWVP